MSDPESAPPIAAGDAPGEVRPPEPVTVVVRPDDRLRFIPADAGVPPVVHHCRAADAALDVAALAARLLPAGCGRVALPLPDGRLLEFEL